MEKHKISVIPGNLKNLESVDEFLKRAQKEIDKLVSEEYEIVSTCSDTVNLWIFWKKSN